MTTDASGGWAKATEEASGAATEGVGALRDIGHFLAPAFAPLVGMAADQFGIWRLKRQARLAERYLAFLRDRGLSGPTRLVDPAFLVPLLEHASVEADDDLQDIWATMLANAADAGSETERHNAFIDMLKGMSAFDVRVLALIHKIGPDTKDGAVYTGNFPDSDSQTDNGHRAGLVREDVAVSLDNLARLGCISPGVAYGGPLITTHVRLTPLGKAFVRSCTRQA